MNMKYLNKLGLITLKLKENLDNKEELENLETEEDFKNIVIKLVNLVHDLEINLENKNIN